MKETTMLKNLYMALAFTMVVLPLHGFSSLQEMIEYTKTYDEIIEPANHDYINADYFPTYATRRPSWLRRLKSKFFGKPYHNTLLECKKVLAVIVRDREIRGFNHRHILQLHHSSDDILIVWGDLQGSFHSFVRSLIELQKRGIIDNELNILKPNYYLVFNGNIVGETDSGLELVEGIASLMLKNPNQVICNAGPLEDHGVWTDYGLIREVSALTGVRGVKFGFSSNTATFNDLVGLITRFFNTLPMALYIDYPQPDAPTKHVLIRISAFGADAPELDTRNFDDFFNSNNNQYAIKDHFLIYRLKNVIASGNPATVRVFITSLPGFVRFEMTEGLIQLEPIDGSLVWALFSGPNIFQQQINKFYFDAFVEIALKSRIEDASVELIHRDSRTKEPFHIKEKYLLTSGTDITKRQGAVPQQKIVVLGADIDLSKGASNIGSSLRKGILAALDDGQENLLPDQTKIRISFFDNKLSTRQAWRNVQDIQTAYKLPIVTFPITAQVMSNYVDLLKNDSLLALFPLVGATELHSKDYPGIIFFRPSFDPEVKALINEEVPQSPNGKFCFFYQDDNFGRSALNAGIAEMKKHNKKFTTISHLPNETNFAQQVKEFKKQDFTAVFFLSLGLAVREFIHQLGTQALVRMNLYGISMLGGQEFQRFLDELGLSMTFSQIVPNPAKSTLPIVQEYRASMDERNITYSVFSLEGYICAQLLIEAAAHITGPITKDSLAAYFTGLKNYDFKGLSLNFRPEYRDLSQTVWLDQGSPLWKEYKGGSLS